MAATYDALYTLQFDNNLKFASQQREPRLLKTVEVDKFAGLTKYFEKILTLPAPTVQQTRFQPVVLGDAGFERRPVTPVSFDEVNGVDNLDRMRSTIEDPTSKILQSQLFAFHRLIDQTVINAATGTAYTQNILNGTQTAVTLPSTQIVAINYDEPGTTQSGNTGLTVGKLKYARALLESQEAIMPDEELWVIHNSAMEQQLLRDQQVTNLFYSEERPLITGKIGQYLGLNFVRSELVNYITAGTAGNPFTGQAQALVYPKSALQFAFIDPLHGRVDPRYDLRGEVWQIKAMASFACIRMFEERVVAINCDLTV